MMKDHVRAEIYGHKLFMAISDIIKLQDQKTFEECKDMIGKSLRDDFSIL